MENKPYIFKLRSKINKHEGFLTYKQIENLVELVDEIRKQNN